MILLKRSRCLVPTCLMLGLAACSQHQGSALRDDHSYAEKRNRSFYVFRRASDQDGDVEQQADAPSAYADLWQRLIDLYALPDVDNSRVDRELRWMSQKTDFIQRVQERAALYLYDIVEQIEQNGFPGEVALLPVIESGFYPKAFSPAAAAGLWQFIPSTGRLYGLSQNRYRDARRDVYESTRAAIRYFRKLQNDFNGDWLLTLAAYNCGEGCVQRAINKNLRQELPVDYWSLDLPEETRHYVPRLIAVARMFANPERYGLTRRPIANRAVFEPVYVGSQIDLKLAARLAEVSMEELLQLNPGHNGRITDPDGPHRLLIPVGQVERFKRKLASIPPETWVPDTLVAQQERALTHLASTELHRGGLAKPTQKAKALQFRKHRVARGETLSGIAQRYGTDVAAIKAINRLRGTVVQRGMQLTIPVAGGAVTTASRAAKPPARYVVRRGETLYGVARKLKVNVKDLAVWNGIKTTTKIKAGQTLVARATTSGGNSSGGRQVVQYTIRKGDTLHSISRQFRVTAGDLQKWNRIRPNRLRPGQQLTVYLASSS